MKKSLVLLTAVTALALTSCSNDEVIDSQAPMAIGFDSFVGKTTRATDASKTNMQYINVYGYIGDATPAKIFDGTQVKNGNNAWTYSPLQYWIAGKNYFFTAVGSPVAQVNRKYSYTWVGDADLPRTTDNFHGTGTIAMDNAAANGNEDVVYAYATKTTPDAITADPGKVDFEFHHALSRVKFTFRNAMESSSYSINVKDVSIVNAFSNGNMTLGVQSPEWTNQSGPATLKMDNNNFITKGPAALGNDVVSATKFIIPGTCTLKISFTVDLMVNGIVVATYNHTSQPLTAEDMAFVPGHSYNFVASLNPKNIDPDNQMFPIEFNVTSVDVWEEEADKTVTLPEKKDPEETPGA